MTTLALLLVSGDEIDRRNSFSSATLFVSTENMTMNLSSSAEEGKLPCVGVVGVEAAESAILESRLQWARCLASLQGNRVNATAIISCSKKYINFQKI